MTGATSAMSWVAAEEMVLGGKSVGTCVGLGSHGIALPPIVKFGTDAQKERYVRPTLTGEKISALGITEPGGGSDVAAVQTKAIRDGDHYIVNGAKTFITSGTRADFVTTAVRTGGEGHGGISMLIIDSDSRGSAWQASSRRPVGGRATLRSSPSKTAASPRRISSVKKALAS